MIRARSSFAILALLTLATALSAQSADRVDALVRKLGSSSFVQREQARKELVAIGPNTLAALWRGAKSADPETRRRIADLIAQFEDQLLSQRVLTPKMIDLKLEGVTVQQAMADIGSKSGYPIQFMGDATPFANKKITLTGKMAFWEAVDRLCVQGGLMEQIDTQPIEPQIYSGRVNRRYVVQPQPVSAGPLKLTVRPKGKAVDPEAWTEKKIRFDASKKGWNDAIVWFCNQTKMPLTGKIMPPKGLVAYPSVGKDGQPREFTVADVFDILNEQLIAEHKLILLRRETTLILVRADEPIPAILVPRCTLGDLPRRAKTEIVEVVVGLQEGVTEEFAPLAKRLLGEFASVTPIPDTNSLILRADVFALRRILASCPKLVNPDRTTTTSLAGSVKTEVRVTRDAKTKELIVTLIAGVEPSLLNSQLVGRPRIAKLVDEGGRRREPAFDVSSGDDQTQSNLYYVNPYNMAQPGQSALMTKFRIAKSSDAKRIAELAGSLTMQLDLQNVELARVEKVMDAAGKSVAGANGGTLRIQSVKRLADKAIEVDIEMENLTPSPFGNTVFINGGNVVIRGNINGNIVINGGNVRINGNGNGKDLPDLVDARGQKFRIANVKKESTSAINGSITRSATIVYQPATSVQAEPRALILHGTRTHTIAVPFRFENVPVP